MAEAGALGVAISFEESLEMGDVAQVLDLIAKGELVDEHFDCGFTPLMSAAASGSAECCRALVDANADVNLAGKVGATPLIIACQHGCADAVFELGTIKSDDGTQARCQSTSPRTGQQRPAWI